MVIYVARDIEARNVESILRLVNATQWAVFPDNVEPTSDCIERAI